MNEQELKRLKEVCRRVWMHMIGEWLRGEPGRIDKSWIFEHAQERVFFEFYPGGTRKSLGKKLEAAFDAYGEEWDRFVKEFA